MLSVQFLIVLPFLAVGLLLAVLGLRALRHRWLRNRSRMRFQNGLAELLRYGPSSRAAFDSYERSTLLLQILPGHTAAIYRSDALHGFRLLQLRTAGGTHFTEQLAFAERAGALEDWTRALLAQGIESGVHEEPVRTYCVRILARPDENLWALGQLGSGDWLPPLHSLAERLRPLFADSSGPSLSNEAFKKIGAPQERAPVETKYSKPGTLATGGSARMSRLIHDVRLPLARAFAMLENLRLQLENGEAEFSHPLARLQRQLRTLESFTYDILNVEQDGRAAIDRSPETINLVERVDAVIDAHRDIIDRKRIELVRDDSTTNGEIHAHPIALDRILFNLLTNSFQFCSSPGQLHLRILSRRQHLVVDLEDSGPGLVSQENTFELSRRNIGRSGSGWGIGLASARELTHRLGGRLVPATPRAGSGARFLLVLPGRPGHSG